MPLTKKGYNLAPIGMSVYTRIPHFKKSIEALQNNILASQSELYIYSDAASKKEDEATVQEVRVFAHSITGFRKVHVIERKINYGGTKNSFSAWKEILENNADGISIYLEDDIVTAPGFLTFMNAALAFYKDDENIISITGYCPPLNIDDYEHDIFVLPRFCGWGCGSFKRTISIAANKIDKDKFNNIINKKVLTVGGADVLKMIEKEVNGEIDAGDVRCMYYQALHDRYTIYPRKSLVENIGIDGSGVHSGKNEKYHHDELWGKTDSFEFVRGIQADERFIKANQKFRRPGFKMRMRFGVSRLSKLLGMHSALKRIQKTLHL